MCIDSSVERLGCVYNRNDAAMSIRARVLVGTYVFLSLRSIPGSRLVGLYGNTTFNLLWSCPAAFQSECTCPHSYQPCVRVLVSPHSASTCSVGQSDDRHASGRGVVSHCSCDSCFPGSYRASFHGLVGLCVSFLEECLPNPLSTLNWVICLSFIIEW